MAGNALRAALSSYGRPGRRWRQPPKVTSAPQPPSPRPRPLPTHPQEGTLRGQGYPGRPVLGGRLGRYVGPNKEF